VIAALPAGARNRGAAGSNCCYPDEDGRPNQESSASRSHRV